jgi:predicted CXXCH cytochrome family protein
MRRSIVSIMLFEICLCLSGSVFGGVLTSKHNLSVSGSGDYIALTETQVCVFCHIPHNSSPLGPLWNREDTGQNYTPYSSSTTDALPGQPTGSSLLCLSCHDGTIALGDLLSRDTDVTMTGGVTTIPEEDRSNLSTDLSDDHPISFDYDEALAGSDGSLVSPALLTDAVRLDVNGQLQCTSCHDPHDDTNDKFLVIDPVNGALCETCHIIFHDFTPHKTSSAEWDGVGDDPWPHTEWNSVQENACFNCHTPHAAAGVRLLKHSEEEENCLICHNGHVAETDLRSVMQKISVHPVDLSSNIHDPVEEALVQARHVECQDCHNGHAVIEDDEDNEPGGALNQIAGIDISGGEVEPITYQYQVCFRCHGDSQDEATIYTDRLVVENNIRLDFNPANLSYHPIAASGQNSEVPSLISPLTPASIIQCTDCHNNDDLESSPRGPHGSNYIPILERQYITTDGTPESIANYALCYKCHDQDSILDDQSFPRHSKHISSIRNNGMTLNTPCNVCHDPHGVVDGGGIGGLHTGSKLINFDRGVVEVNSEGKLYYESTGSFEGKCYLSCHGKNHNPCSYDGNSANCGTGPGSSD